jgi:hypothetical protein
VALAVTAATDEGGLSLGARLARVVPLAPAYVGVAVAVALGGSRTRGEIRTLEATGRPPLFSAAAVAAGAVAVGMVLSAWVLWGSDGALRTFYPSVTPGSAFTFHDDAFWNIRAGYRVTVGGAVAWLPPGQGGSAASSPLSPLGLPGHARTAAALATTLGSLAFGLTMALVGGKKYARAVAATLATAAGSTVCFQAAAAGRLSALWAVAPPLVLLGGAAYVAVSRSWREESRRLVVGSPPR